MALKCPECGTVAHARTAAYEAPSVKRSWYQCQNLECSCTFTGKRLVRTVLIFTESSDQLSRATDRVPGLPASPGYVQ